MLRHDGIVKVLDFGLASASRGKARLRSSPPLRQRLAARCATCRPNNSGTSRSRARAISTPWPRVLRIGGRVSSIRIVVRLGNGSRHPHARPQAPGRGQPRDAGMAGRSDRLHAEPRGLSRPSARDVESALARETWEMSQPQTRRTRPRVPDLGDMHCRHWSCGRRMVSAPRDPPWRLKAVPFTQYPGMKSLRVSPLTESRSPSPGMEKSRTTSTFIRARSGRVRSDGSRPAHSLITVPRGRQPGASSHSSGASN